MSQRVDTKAHSSETCANAGVEKEVQDAPSKVGLPLHEAENSQALSRPNKPMKEYQAGAMTEDHKPAQEVSKIQKGTGRLKRVAREKG